MLALVLFIICVLSVSAEQNEANNYELVLTETLFRHGARTTYRFYANDPHRNSTFFPTGPGGLTNEGKLHMYNLGEFLKDHYRHFLGEVYHNDLLETRSTDVTRTKMSALLLLAGMWPPTDQEKWHPTLNWQPIPVIAIPRPEEELLSPSNCAYRRKILTEQWTNPEVQDKYITPFKETFEYIQKHSGFEVKDPIDALEFYFILSTENEMNLALPEWTTKIYPEPLTSIAANVYGYWNHNDRVRKIHAGTFLKKIITEFEAKANKTLTPPDRKMFLYAGHESTLGYVLNALELADPHIPPYGSAIMFELVKNEKDEHFVRIKYHTDLKATPKVLQIPDCGQICPLWQFIDTYKHLVPTLSFDEMCRL